MLNLIKQKQNNLTFDTIIWSKIIEVLCWGDFQFLKDVFFLSGEVQNSELTFMWGYHIQR